MPGTVLNPLHVLAHLTLTKVFRNIIILHTMKKLSTESLNNLPKVLLSLPQGLH